MNTEQPSDTGVRLGIALSSLRDPATEARSLETLGFDLVSCGEHVAFNAPTPNAFISLSAAAGATSKVRLLSAVALAPLYPPALLAKLGAALDVASGGRFELGVGIGGEYPAEFEACGVPLKERGARTSEALRVLNALWSQEDVSFQGRFSNFTGLSIAPPPIRQAATPVWVSGRADAAARRAAELGTGWLPYMYTPDMLAGSMELIKHHTDRKIDSGIFLWTAVHEDPAHARTMAAEAMHRIYKQDFSRLLDKYCLVGTPMEAVRRLHEFISAGARTIVMSPACPQDSVEDMHRLIAGEVLPVLSGATS